MREKYEPPKIETEIFSSEMMQAACDVGPGDLELSPIWIHYAYLGYNCSCKDTGQTWS